MKKLIIPKQTIAKEEIVEPVVAEPSDQPVEQTEVVETPAVVETEAVVPEEQTDEPLVFEQELMEAVGCNDEDTLECNNTDLMVAVEQLQDSLVSEIQENEKVADIAENFSDMADTVEASPNSDLSDTEKQLVASSINMAVSGTDEDARDIAPSMESFADKALLISELRKKHQIATEGIADSFQKVFTKFAEFIKGVFSFASKIEYKLRDAKKTVASLKASKQKQIEIQFTKSSYLKKNMTEYATTYDEYLATLKRSVEFFGKFAPSAVKSVGDFKGSIFEFWTTVPGSEKTFEAASKLYNSYINEFVDNTKNLPGMKEIHSDIPHIKKYSSEPLLGGFSVYVADYTERAEAKEDNVVEMKNTINNSYVIFSRDYLPIINTKNTNDNGKLTYTVEIKFLEETLSEVEKALKVFKVFLNESYKSFTTIAAFKGIRWEWNGKLLSLHNFIINRGINNANFYVGYAREYSKILCSAPLDVVNKIASSSKWERE
jgi:hypothetical protein